MTDLIEGHHAPTWTALWQGAQIKFDDLPIESGDVFIFFP